MREILFRGRRMKGPYCEPSDEDGSKWYIGKYFQFGEAKAVAEKGLQFAVLEKLERKPGVFGGHAAFVAPDTVGQWTGLTDRDGIRVFEGDILVFKRCVFRRSGEKEETEELGIVFWDEDRAGFMLRCGPWGKEALFSAPGIEKNFRVIGNIHDNPELVQKVEDADFGFAVRTF